MFSFVKSVLAVTLIFFPFASASAAVVTIGGASDGSSSYSIYTLDLNGNIIHEAPIAYNAFANNYVKFTVNPAKNLLFLWNPWDNNCFNCILAFDITKGGNIVYTEHVTFPFFGCIQAASIDYDPKQDQWFFGCQSSLVIKQGSSMQQVQVPFSPKYTTFDPYTNSVYSVGSGNVNQFNIATNTSTEYKIPTTDVVTLSNVVGAASGQAFIAGRFFNTNQKVYQVEWFNVANNQKNWLAPVKNTVLKSHQVLGKATFDADSQSIVWIDAPALFKYNTVSGQITAHPITYKNKFVPWLTSFGVSALNN
jgi:hypothetical protein